MNDVLSLNASALIGLSMRTADQDEVEIHGRYHVECFDADGISKWVEDFDNLVTTVGKNDLLDKYFAGSAYTAALVLALKGSGTAVVGDTMASHAAWSEVGGTNAPAYTGNRQAPAWSVASSGSKVMSAALTYTFTSGGTVAGCFMVSGGSATKDNTTGVLYSAGDFASARTVASGDTLSVTYTASA